MTDELGQEELHPYDLFIVAVSLLALFALIINALFVTHPEATRLLEFADLLFCGLFGTMSGLFASWLVHRERDEARELAQLRQEVRALRERLGVGPRRD